MRHLMRLGLLGIVAGCGGISADPGTGTGSVTGTGTGTGSGGGVPLGGVTVELVASADGTRFSSTAVKVSWPASEGADHSRVTATESVGGTSVVADTKTAEVKLAGLKSSTAYSVSVETCFDAGCSAPVALGSANTTTPEEVWHLQGTGAGISQLANVVSDGNAKIWGIWYGPDAPPSLAGRVQLYYGMLQSMSVMGQNLGVGLASSAADAKDLSTLIPLTGTAGKAGLISPTAAGALIGSIMTGQAVPLASGKMRLYFETNGSDSHARIASIDSVDGLVGQDFNAGASTICKETADYAPAGGCAPTVVLGVDGDAVQPVARVANVRQFKIAYPTLDSWAWDEAPGTFMFFTIDKGGQCGYLGFANQAYAVWSGTAWEPVLREDGCPKAIEGLQAPAPVHLGGVRYKLYGGDPSDKTGALMGSKLPFLGPKLVLYGDGASTGDAKVVEFDDWESRTSARGTTFLWPDGTELDAGEEGYIDDFVFMTPTGTTAFQVAYVVITDGKVIPRPALAVLLNP
ncbi:MAG: fibronectin type III domain-containing protein [Myxococcales bacterium]|nr:fibronectin type III domain-containing protein [Myxococcales bacterium]